MSKKIIIYSAPNCTNCLMLKQWLTNSKRHFTEIDVSNNPALLKKLVKRNNTLSLPIILVDNKFIHDATIRGLEKILNESTVANASKLNI